ncbi:hypothetical protein CY34DRAFT_814069 [Suillus luteus UH-Slu-Lm8-n1]|uniref:Uncharacterized protein n=1 Tax=Suillus luteus UH-Slu-Lm8-n1 TaxID=930992 RepID=A0A0D0AEY3_9AGAM|nr:hypothetical protein CY34DRAFT_814069 [Suillus luteus UH-Slu-Lm8-n1]
MRQEPAQTVCTIPDMVLHHNVSRTDGIDKKFSIRKQVSHLLYDGTEKKSYMVERQRLPHLSFTLTEPGNLCTPGSGIKQRKFSHKTMQQHCNQTHNKAH